MSTPGIGGAAEHLDDFALGIDVARFPRLPAGRPPCRRLRRARRGGERARLDINVVRRGADRPARRRRNSAICCSVPTIVSWARSRMRMTRPSGDPALWPGRNRSSRVIRATTLSPCIAVPVFSAAMKRSCSPGFSRGRNADSRPGGLERAGDQIRFRWQDVAVLADAGDLAGLLELAQNAR